jgi:hypothetical protein
MIKFPFFIVMVLLFMIPLQAQVLGPCGSGGEGTEPQTVTILKTSNCRITTVNGACCVFFRQRSLLSDRRNFPQLRTNMKI